MIYLEPRSTYDQAIIDSEPHIIYGYEKLIELLCEELECEWLEAVDFYCYNIEPLINEGLMVLDD